MVENQQAPASDINARVQGFNEELKPLLKKYRLVLGAQPAIRPDGGLAAAVHVYAEEELKPVNPPAPAAAPAESPPAAPEVPPAPQPSKVVPA